MVSEKASALLAAAAAAAVGAGGGGGGWDDVRDGSRLAGTETRTYLLAMRPISAECCARSSLPPPRLSRQRGNSPRPAPRKVRGEPAPLPLPGG
ncbi:hypothetical protein chiPu_0033424, partial [Chiloscyllium punctatum]|nr:hypothetical protein [Chiloscyllium punctatum]